jgi:magnesium transporter
MTFAVALDFSTKQERTVTLDDVNDARARGSYCWIDLHAPSDDELRKFLESLKIGHEPIDEIAEFDRRPAFNVYSKCLHFTLAEARMVDGSFQTVTLHVVVGDGFLVTVHQQELEMLHRTRKTYSEGFQTAALSPGFLLFELADHLAYVCGHTLTMFEDQIEEIEAELFGKADDDIFLPVSELIRSLLQFRKAVVASREVIHELATRRSPFVSETTQPYLEKKAVLLERLSADATTEREVLSEFLNLYMGIISHRTNRVVTQLTIISSIFLPLAFVTGLHGMNFDTDLPWNMPELRHEFGYLGFWIFSGVLVVGMVLWMRLRRWF